MKQKNIMYKKTSYNIELELNGKNFEILINEDYDFNSETIVVDWDNIGDTELTDEEYDLVDDWVKNFKYDTQTPDYKKAFNILMKYFDSISDEEKPKVDEQLKKLGLGK